MQHAQILEEIIRERGYPIRIIYADTDSFLFSVQDYTAISDEMICHIQKDLETTARARMMQRLAIMKNAATIDPRIKSRE